MKLTHVGFANYRSIGSDFVWIDLTRKVNVVIGPNNSGKSNILRACTWLNADRLKEGEPIPPIDKHQCQDNNLLQIGIKAVAEPKETRLFEGREELTFLYERGDDRFVNIANPFQGLPWSNWHDLYTSETNMAYDHGPSDEQIQKDQATVALEVGVRLLKEHWPGVRNLQPFRQITAEGGYSLNGQGLIPLLGRWQTPEIGNEEDRKNFEAIGELLRKLLHLPNVTIQIPPSADKVIVEQEGLRLPLESYGTGVHELIILAVAVLAQHDALFCIEEPEIHLHPRLQKELLQFLIDETDNRYLLTTHSSALLPPSEDVSVLRLWLEDGATHGQDVTTTGHAVDVLDDLGVRASDLFQANSVIWVEGPSDRVYINAWLALLVPDLREGIDYSIMFYGGSLRSHLTLQRNGDPSAKDMIQLLRINQHSAVVMDRDTASQSQALSKTKERIRDECKKSDIPCWITWGREIENYLPKEAISDAYAKIAPISPPTLFFSRFAKLEGCLSKAYGGHWKKGWSYNADKPGRARQITQHIDKARVSQQLETDLQPIIEMIEKAK